MEANKHHKRRTTRKGPRIPTPSLSVSQMLEKKKRQLEAERRDAELKGAVREVRLG
jgi:hypothetical protein